MYPLVTLTAELIADIKFNLVLQTLHHLRELRLAESAFVLNLFKLC